MNKISSKPFLKSLLWKQNGHHKHGVLVHTLKVVYNVIKAKQYRMIPAAILHDIGKPFSAKQRNQEDIDNDWYSFHNHEELSYHIIKKCPFISDYTKQLVRWHYLIRGEQKAIERGEVLKYNRLVKRWNSFNYEFKQDLAKFKEYDDNAK